MSIFYAASTGGFYCADIHGDLMPADAVPVSDDEHGRLLSGQAAGQRIVPDAAGRPALADQLRPNADEQRAALRAERDRLLAASDFSQMPDAPLTKGQRDRWRAYRQALRDLPAASDLTAVQWPVPPA